MIAEVNWIALALGVVAAFAQGFFLYGPWGLQKGWAKGSRLEGMAPGSMPMGALAWQLAALILLALVIAITATTDSLGLAILMILAVAAQAGSVGAWAQKNAYAIAVDTGYALGSGALMILAHALI